MAKRLPSKSVQTAVDTLAQSVADDASARLSQERRLEMIRNVNKPEYIEHNPFELIYTDYSFNPRETESYGIDANPDLYDSLKKYGIDPTKPPITLSKEADGRLLTLRGNLRMSVITDMNREAEKAGLPLPFPTIPALVYSNLTPDEKILIMADHTGQKELNRYELAMMVGKAALARRFTDKEGATYFGLGASTVQRLRQTYMMPPVLEDLKKEVHVSKRKGVEVPESEKPFVFTQKELSALYNGYGQDQAINPVPRWTDGPNFKIAWDGVMEARRGLSKTAPTKARKATELDSLVKTYIESPSDVVADAAKLVAWAKGDDNETAYSIVSRIKSADDAKVREIADLKNEVTTLRADLDVANATITELTGDVAALRAENESLRADNRALADMIPTPAEAPAETPSES